MIASHLTRGGVCFAFTDRWGGVSKPPFDEFNLAGHTGDDTTFVAENRRLLAGRIGVPVERVVYMNQVHGAAVAKVNTAEPPVPSADAMVTTQRGLALAVLVADCVPVLLADPTAGVVGVAHAGRAGLLAGVVPAVVQAMRDAGGHGLIAQVGPAVCGACYEVPEAMRADVTASVPGTWAVTRAGSPALDLAGGVFAQLDELGVQCVTPPASAAQVAAARHRSMAPLAPCTVEDNAYFSYRRDRTTGRFAGLVWIEQS